MTVRERIIAPTVRSVSAWVRRCGRRVLGPDREDGWTFIETIIVIGIILILTSSVGFMAYRYIDRAKQAAAQNQIETIVLALNAYMLDCGRYPTEEQGLQALWEKPHLEPVPSDWTGPYVGKKIPLDPWGEPYEYTEPGPNGLPFAVMSFGADRTEGGEGDAQDLSSWESR
jgi:general secretion pathway protein G